ncbi:MAG TPA: efflux RND transporter periplasmic adaptor subunit [Candidatus Cybelea sp.]|jgi:HlyD family secretion protein|nr:efflux RND transporter periplasmic adaptor subunit [Candidatus Cybelea sp.]
MSTISIPAPRGLGAAAGSIFGKLPRALWIVASLLLGGGILAICLLRSHASDRLITAPITQTDLVASVTASGTVNPQNLISVGTQVSGTIASIAVDYNSKVKQGQVLARLDPSTFQAQLDQANAAVAQAQAQVAQAAASASGATSGIGAASATAAAELAAVASAKANVGKTQAALFLAQKTASRDSALLSQGYVAQNTVDTDRATVVEDSSDVAAAQAAVAQAQAQDAAGNAAVGENTSTAQSQAAGTEAAQANVAAAQAVVRQDELNLQHSIITSPVDGTVVARDVSVGQTVAASLQTPTLFSIAQNLGKMEVDINVGEPDIGNVKPGDTVSFSVLAYPNELFHGTVSQVRINPQTLNNVVTYDVVVYAENTGGKLLPGMTANATIDVADAKNALTVPLAALHQTTSESGEGAATPWGSVSGSAASGAVAAGSTARLSIDRNGKAVPIGVYVRLTNGTQAAVEPLQGASLTASDRVVIGTGQTHRTAGQSARAPIAGAAPGGMRGLH